MFGAQRYLVGTLAVDHHDQTGIRCLHSDFVVEAQCQTDAVETGAEVGAGGRYHGARHQPGRQHLGHQQPFARSASVATGPDAWQPAAPGPAALAIATRPDAWQPAAPGPAALAIATRPDAWQPAAPGPAALAIATGPDAWQPAAPGPAALAIATRPAPISRRRAPDRPATRPRAAIPSARCRDP